MADHAMSAIIFTKKCIVNNTDSEESISSAGGFKARLISHYQFIYIKAI